MSALVKQSLAVGGVFVVAFVVLMWEFARTGTVSPLGLLTWAVWGGAYAGVIWFVIGLIRGRGRNA